METFNSQRRWLDPRRMPNTSGIRGVQGVSQMHVRPRYWATLIVVTVAVAAAVVTWRLTRPAQYTLRLTPITPPTTQSCVSEAEHFGYSAAGGANICQPGNGRNWYRAVLTNRGSYGLPACTATGFDRRGHKLFTGTMVFGIGGIRGLFVAGHSTISFAWYLPGQQHRPIDRYTATCSPSPSPFA
jgi:hypothetical protein